MKRVSLNKRQAKELGLGGRAEEARFEDASVLLQDGKPVFVLKQGRRFPFLTEEQPFTEVVVDMGAVPFVTKGADVMGPGITEPDEAEEGSLVIVRDEKNRKNLAVGIVIKKALRTPGKSVRILHHVGDKYWEAWKSGFK